MDIRLIYTDADRVEQGYLRNFSADVDVAKDKDFEITVARDNNILDRKSTRLNSSHSH